MDTVVKTDLVQAKRGGHPTTLSLVEGYLKVKAVRSGMAGVVSVIGRMHS